MPRFIALDTKTVRSLQSGGLDAYGHAPERQISDGAGNPCRHCLKDIPAGEDMLILAHRPFGNLHPYAETGPIFLCADTCPRGGGETPAMPHILRTSPDYLVKGYNAQERIVYGTGEVVKTPDIPLKIEKTFENPEVSFLHVRSARNNCYQVRVERD